MEAGEILINRTNNALERYNRRLGNLFPDSNHPSMTTFVSGIQYEARAFVDDLEAIKKGEVKLRSNIFYYD